MYVYIYIYMYNIYIYTYICSIIDRTSSEIIQPKARTRKIVFRILIFIVSQSHIFQNLQPPHKLNIYIA
jgi:hypothetical protein